MTQIELKTMNIICSSFPKVAEELKRIADSLETHTCCICGKEFHGHGNNPHPIEIEGVCCDECNVKVVLERIKQLESEVNNG